MGKIQEQVISRSARLPEPLILFLLLSWFQLGGAFSTFVTHPLSSTNLTDSSNRKEREPAGEKLRLCPVCGTAFPGQQGRGCLGALKEPRQAPSWLFAWLFCPC